MSNEKKENNIKNKLYISDARKELKKLNEHFNNKIQLIYIDPPYNTERNDLSYKDNRNIEDFKNLLKDTLKKSYNLLKKEGIIFVSINSKTYHIVRNILDEVYGEKNYLGTIVRIENAKKQKFKRITLKENYEFVIGYAKNKKLVNLNLIENEDYTKYRNYLFKLYKKLKKENKEEIYIEDYINSNILPSNKEELKLLKNIWILQEKYKGLQHYKYIHNNKILRNADINMYLGKGCNYNLVHPLTKKICKKPKYGYPDITKLDGWKLEGNNLFYNKEIIKISRNKILCGNLILGIDENKIPDYANELDILEPPSTIINITGSDDRYLTSLIGEKVFDYPKPKKLLEYLIKISTKENDYILDFFAGSGTTGEAAYFLKRNFILIQQKEEIKNKKIKNEKLKYISDIITERFNKLKIPFQIIDD